MTLATRAEIITDLGNYMHRSDLASIAPTFIKQTEQYLNRNLRVREMITATTQAVAADDTSFTLPANFNEMLEVAVQGKPPMEFINSSVLRGRYADRTDIPTVYTIVGNELRFGPAADAAYTLDLDYYAKVTPLTDAVTTNEILDAGYGDLYLYGCLTFGKAYVKDQSMIGYFADSFQGQVKSLTKDHRNAKYGRSGLRQRAS